MYIRDVITLASREPQTVILAHVLKKSREWVLAHPEAIVHPSRAARFRRLLARLHQGEPLTQIIGEQWFYGRPFTVNRNVLIPRPETEQLAELAIRRIKNHESRIMAIDVGTGSGCIAVTIAAELPKVRVFAIDSSIAALRLAQRNARRCGVANHITFLHGDLLSPLLLQLSPVSTIVETGDSTYLESIKHHSPFVVCANLPYLTTAEWRALPRSLKIYEPRAAFDGGRDGLKYFRELFAQLGHIAGGDPKGKASPSNGAGGTPPLRRLFARIQTIPIIHNSLSLILEIDPRRKIALAKLVHAMLPDWRVTWHRDLAGRWRTLELINPSTTPSRSPS